MPIQSSRAEDIEYDNEKLEEQYPDPDCWLVALDDWEIAVILSSLRYAHWTRRWRNLGSLTWDEIEAKITNLEYCLMAGCNVQNLIKTNLMMIAAMTGQSIDLDDIDDDYFTGEKDYTSTGLANRIGPEALHTAETSISYRLGVVSDFLVSISNRFTFDDKNITETLSEIAGGNVAEAIDHLAEQFIYRDGEEETDIAKYAKNLSETLSDLKYDLRYLLLVYNDKSISQIISELPIADITEAVNGLELVANCAPDVNCGSGEGGTQPPSEPGTEGGTPPTGWEEPPEVTDRKCKVANAIHENYVQWIERWDFYGVDNFSVITYTALFTLLGICVGEISTPVPLIDGLGGAVVGFFSGCALAILGGGFDLEQLLSAMDTYEQDLVCALYNATSATEAQEAYWQVLRDNGVTTGNIALLQAAMIVDIMNTLFFTPEGAKGAEIEAALENYTGGVDCDECNPVAFEFRYSEVLPGQHLVEGEMRVGSTFTAQNGVYVGLHSMLYLLNISGRCLKLTIDSVTENYTPRTGDYPAQWIDCENVTNYVQSGVSPVGMSFEIGPGSDLGVKGGPSANGTWDMTFTISEV